MSQRKLTAVDNVSLAVGKGDVLGVVGESGSGKTTLSKMLLGLTHPTSGDILLDGQPVGAQSPRAIARKVQFVFQDPFSSLNPRRRVEDIVAHPLHIHGIETRQGRSRRARELLDVVGLPSRVRDAYPAQLSGGQRQRVAIARALALRPEALVCDEPTSALDASVQAQILNLLLDLRREFGLTYVIVSHNLSVVEHMATKVAVMYLGRIVEFASAESLFLTPQHPYSRVLLASAMTIAPGAGLPSLQLNGQIPSAMATPRGCRFHPRCPEVLEVCRSKAPQAPFHEQGYCECHLSQGSVEVSTTSASSIGAG